MKKIIVLFLMLFVIVKLQAQNYQISFAGAGASTGVDSVKVEDLTQCTNISLSGGDVLNLTATGINELEIKNEELGINVFPNPMTGSCRIDFEATSEGAATIALYDITGKKMTQIQEYLALGNHAFKMSGIGGGIYMLHIESAQYSYSAKIVSVASITNCELRITNYQTSTVMTQDTAKDYGIMKSLKYDKSQVYLKYTTGDMLKFTGYSGNYSTALVEVPNKSETVTFNYIACTDNDKNNYTIVQEGTQTWMEENLRTTTYTDGTQIPNVTDDTAWINLTTPAYCWYNDSARYKNIYGAIYNWYAVNTGKLCPTGWHVPDSTEWKTLMGYLGGADVAGGKLKDACLTNWDFPNTGATNSSGFTALPDGLRYPYGGIFNLDGFYGSWWTAGQFDATTSYYFFLYYNTAAAGLDKFGLKFTGFSVRCLMNN